MCFSAGHLPAAAGATEGVSWLRKSYRMIDTRTMKLCLAFQKSLGLPRRRKADSDHATHKRQVAVEAWRDRHDLVNERDLNLGRWRP